MAAALHVASAADERTPLGEAVARTPAWVAGLDPASALAAVADVALAAGEAGEAVEVALARVLAMPEMDQAVSAADREYHSTVGYRAARLGLGRPGVGQVTTTTATLAKLSGSTAALVRAQQRRFDDIFGAGADGPLFFDPDADEPAPLGPDAIARAAEQILAGLDLSEATRYAYRLTGLLPPARGATWPAERVEEIRAARAEWGRAHGVGPTELDVSWAADLAKSAALAATATVAAAADDAEFAADLIGALEQSDDPIGEDILAMFDSAATDADLDDTVIARAVEFAHAWHGAALGDRVRAQARHARTRRRAADAPAALALLAAIRTTP